ncbi:MAG: hypothetical protein DRO46_01005 [Candidatus Hecatellales archaeon]|nr:MAG: hypothetical protein DRO46_01005 [Candidatus Hecatellales archaeon]
MAGRKPLNFSKEYKQKILSGEKRSTIRLRTSLKLGEIVEVNVGGEKIGTAQIVKVERKRLEQLTDNDARQDGFRNVKELLRALRKHYGKLPRNAEVYILGFKFKAKGRRRKKG